jgi:hypothetical protein
MLPEDYNFNTYSGKASESCNHASGHISECIKCLDEHLYIYLQNNNIKKPARSIGKKIKQFSRLHNDNNGLVDLMNKLVGLRNAFQHVKEVIEGQQIYIRYRGDKIKLENELIQNFQKDYNFVSNWFIAHNRDRNH